MRRYLIVANQTLGGQELVRAVQERVTAGPCEFWVVVPATPVTHLEPTYLAMPVMGGMPAVAGSPEEALAVAKERLQAAVRQLRALGATVDGEVGDPDPLKAAQAAAAARNFDEIIVSTLPTRLSRWLRQDLPRRLEHRLGRPVVHIASWDEEMASVPASAPQPAPEPARRADPPGRV